MLFCSLQYCVFLPIVVLLYWLLPKFRKPLLVVASYCFYMSWLPAYGVLLFGLTLANYIFGLVLERNRKKHLLYLAVAFNLAALCYYKYANFLVDAVFKATNFAGGLVGHSSAVSTEPVLNVILPLGISFFAFEFIHYVVDVYRGSQALRKPLDFFVFASFFPSQIAGPIKRYQDFEKQLNEPKRLQRDDILEAFGFLLKGYFKKRALADNLAPFTAFGAGSVHSLGTIGAWVVMVAFVLQVYYDFSGYTDIGIGSARLLGFRLPNNFNLPYVSSRNMIEFWQRWHITLTTWLRDYVLTPITGFRASKLRFHVGTLITMTACGLWHGAAWHFVAWGFLHGIVLVLTREYQQLVRGSELLRRVHGYWLSEPVAKLGTVMQWMLLATFFLAKSVPDALSILHNMFVSTPGVELVREVLRSPLPEAFGLYCVFGLFCITGIPWLTQATQLVSRRVPARLALYAVGFAAVLLFGPKSSNPFIYFQF